MTDLSHRILKYNKRYFSEEKVNPYVDIVCLACDCAHLPIDDGCIDMVVSNAGFESKQSKMMEGFREAYRVPKPGGYAVYYISIVGDHNSENTKKWERLYRSLDETFSLHDKLFDIVEWEDICRNTGYVSTKTRMQMGGFLMKEINITNRNNDYQRFEVLKTNRNKRYRYNEFLVEGVRSLNEAVNNGWSIRSWIYDKSNLSGWAKDMIHNVKTETNYNLTPMLLKELSGKEDTSELMAVIKMRDDCLDKVRLSSNPFIVLFDRPSNKGNLGTMIRSCDALGADLLIITGHAVDLYEPDVVVAAMGSFFNLPIVRVADNNKLYEYIEDLKIRYPKFTVVGTTAHKEDPVYNVDLSVPVLLMLGNETMGLNKAFKEYCDVLCTIPMAEHSYATSFNVSCAGAILMYEIIRQRRLVV